MFHDRDSFGSAQQRWVVVIVAYIGRGVADAAVDWVSSDPSRRN